MTYYSAAKSAEKAAQAALTAQGSASDFATQQLCAAVHHLSEAVKQLAQEEHRKE